MIGEQPFPYRNLILFITFIVILVTLVFQGLTLPWLIRKVKLEDKYGVMPEEDQKIIIQKKLAKASLMSLEEKYGKDRLENEHLQNLMSRLQLDVDFFKQNAEDIKSPEENSLRNFQHIYLELLVEQRKLLNKMNKLSEFDEDLIRKYLSLIDMEEFKLREKIIIN